MKIQHSVWSLWSAAVIVLAVLPAQAADNWLDLSGKWSFALDPNDVGVGERWFEKQLSEDIRLPGSLQEQGYGNDVSVDTPWTGNIVDQSWFSAAKYEQYRQPGNIKLPFWLQPKKHYVGPAWYQRDVEIPVSWQGDRILLLLERCHWETTVWVDGSPAGSQDSLSTDHIYDLSELLQPGRHRLTIRVDNRIKDINVGANAHSVADHTQTNWNGIIGAVGLMRTAAVWVEHLQVFPDVRKRRVSVHVTLGNATNEGGNCRLTLDARAIGEEVSSDPPAVTSNHKLAAGNRSVIRIEYPLGDDVQLWDEFNPVVYSLLVGLSAETPNGRYADEFPTAFGMREIRTEGTQFVLNDQPISLRGTLECCIFPRTGYPPTDVPAWDRIFQTCKSHGLNHLRFHSWCPSEAAFVAADQLGFYLQVECSAWANQGASIGDGKPVDRWLYDEADRILENFGNHPSFLLMAYGNEPAGPGRGGKFLGPWVKHFQEKDPRRIYTGAAGWPLIPENQFHNSPQPRIQQWGAGLSSRINARPPETVTDYRDYVAQFDVPVVSHEIGQWCAYPNFDEMAKYTGLLQPKNFEIFRDFLQANHMGEQARDFVMASGKLQALCYKEEIESSLRTPGFGGFQLLDLHDFPGQGTALIGVLDPFWDSKPYLRPEQFRRFCNATVPLARLPNRVFMRDQSLSASIDVYHYGPADLEDAVVVWELLSEADEAVASGQFAAKTIARGRLNAIGNINVSLADAAIPGKLKLIVGIEQTTFENDWDLWVYPNSTDASENPPVTVAHWLDDAAMAALRAGDRVLLLLPPKTIKGDVSIGFSSVFWNTAWTRNQAPHTLGILCDPKHPALADFPTEYHTNWQWWELIQRSGAMVLDDLPPELRPIVQVIDTWFEARRLGLAIEAKVCGGKLLVCSMDLSHDLENRPVARQMRCSLLKYMSSDAFEPAVEATAEQIRSLFQPPSRMQQLGATVMADSQQPGYPADNALDGNPETIWHTGWGDLEKPFPHYLTVDLKRPLEISGLVYVPRQDMTNGRIAKFKVHLSDDGQRWSEAVATGTWPNTGKRQQVTFDASQAARYVKLIAESEVNGNVWASAAEIEVIVP